MRLPFIKKLICSTLLITTGVNTQASPQSEVADTICITSFGVTPNSRLNTSTAIQKAIDSAKCIKGKKVVIAFPKGRYDFYEVDALKRDYYISNHDQDNPKTVGIVAENLDNVSFEGNGSNFIFHGRMLPFALIDSKNCELRNFSIDFEIPHIQQAKVLENDTIAQTIRLEIAPWVRYEIENNRFYAYGEGWRWTPNSGIAFEGKTRHIVFNTSDISVYLKDVKEIAPNIILAKGWKNPQLIPNTVIALRSWNRPAPGIFMSHNLNTKLYNVQVHYSEGMGLLAQLCENIYMDKFSICLKGDNDPRYFTTQADATHFSGCKGIIVSENGLYEGMMDDAINVHGTYLKVIKRINDRTILAKYMHEQSWGFEWGRPGDKIQLIKSNTMEIFDKTNTISSIKPIDKPTNKGATLFEIAVTEPITSSISNNEDFGIENLTWTPEVVFRNNVIRNNRARGSLFSTPKRTIVENNFFDHTSGSAILLCGDCNGWFETGACKEVIIRGNRFLNALTNYFQFTNAVISIYPEIPNIKEQKKYFHSGIVIENNLFEMFDAPLVYAKSTNGLIFRNNTIKTNKEYLAFHWNKHPFLFERVANFEFKGNDFDGKELDLKKRVKTIK